jgi:hypothetical protein
MNTLPAHNVRWFDACTSPLADGASGPEGIFLNVARRTCMEKTSLFVLHYSMIYFASLLDAEQIALISRAILRVSVERGNYQGPKHPIGDL